MDSIPSANGYVFHPQQVAATLWRRCRGEAGARHHGLCSVVDQDGVSVRVPLKPESDVDLFRLWVPTDSLAKCRVESPFGSAILTLSELERSEPDPLWDACDGICSHMENDHSDTFPLFCRMMGSEWGGSEAEIFMPWVESSGFFLSGLEGLVFVPFPKRCESANSVRVSLITMLRGARAANFQ